MNTHGAVHLKKAGRFILRGVSLERLYLEAKRFVKSYAAELTEETSKPRTKGKTKSEKEKDEETFEIKEPKIGKKVKGKIDLETAVEVFSKYCSPKANTEIARKSAMIRQKKAKKILDKFGAVNVRELSGSDINKAVAMLKESTL